MLEAAHAGSNTRAAWRIATIAASIAKTFQALPENAVALVAAYQSDRGLSMADVAAMITMKERLVLEKSTTLLHASYFLNGELHEMLQSYLLLFEMAEAMVVVVVVEVVVVVVVVVVGACGGGGGGGSGGDGGGGSRHLILVSSRSAADILLQKKVAT